MADEVVKSSTQAVVDQDGDSQLSGDHQRVLRLEGAADVNAELAEIGLSNKSGWYASTLLYGAGGFVVVLAWLLNPDTVPVELGILGGFSLLLSALSAIGARFLLNDDWATHVRLSLGLAIFGAGALLAGDVRVAFAMMPLFVLITPTFLYGARFALPYACVITPMMFLVVFTTPGAAPFAQAVITAGATLMITVSLMAAEHRTRGLARLNRHLAYTDALTGIANTRRLREVLADTLMVGRSFALFAIDLDNFKEVNDRFGHQVGDRVLQAVAAELVAEVGAGELVARRGGDEFSVLVPDADAVDLDRVGDRLSRAITRARLAACPQVTPSGSVAWVTSEEDDSISSVLQRADDALHSSKQAFREGAGEEADGAQTVEAAPPKPVDRQAALRSVSAAVSRAYDGGESGFRRRVRAYRERFGAATSGHVLVWSYLAMTLAPIGLAYVLLAAFGALGEQPVAVGIVSGLALLALAGLAFRAGRRTASKNLIFWTLLAAIAFVSWAVAAAGADGVALLDTYVVLGLFGFYVLRPRYAIVLMVLCGVLFASFSLLGDFPFGEIRSAVTVAVMVVAALIIVKVRSLTLGFVRENRELSEVDPLTGVANLRALRLRVESAIERAESSVGPGRPALMTIDLDRFKEVNDQYNHTTGDQMLESVARAISECVRIEEMVARRGGDEFFVLFDSTSAEHVSTVTPRVSSAAAHARARICPDLTSTVTVGFVEWQPGWDADTFLAEADAIMHDEKIETRARGYESAANH